MRERAGISPPRLPAARAKTARTFLTAGLQLKTSDFDFELPAALIAQEPSERRDESRLMVVDRAAGTIAHHTFREVAGFVPADDLLVLNTTRVFRARLLGKRDSGAPAELLLLRPLGSDRWEAMVHPGAKLKPGRVVHLAADFAATILQATERGTRVVQLAAVGGVAEAIERHGHVPLPPYIERPDSAADAERYQTVYATENGSVAAPTAGLHFTAELLGALAAKGVRRADVLLHVGAGTFKPVEAEDLTAHEMHEEWYRVTAETAAAINEAHARHAKVWAVGTTTVRTLESVADTSGLVHAGEGETRIFIHPPSVVRSVDRLVTNFHLPRSTLLMLVAAFAGLDLMREAYAMAVAERYRFYSYGDAMLIL
ncbi:MAG: tRNA preQ1(34) S-adenosylmethionine ribosyltransferase-isomerase QueA [Gemmatimonadales bacterium]